MIRLSIYSTKYIAYFTGEACLARYDQIINIFHKIHRVFYGRGVTRPYKLIINIFHKINLAEARLNTKQTNIIFAQIQRNNVIAIQTFGTI